MFRTDYLLQVLERFARALARVVRARENDDLEEAEERVGEATRLLLDAELDPLVAEPPEETRARLSGPLGLDQTRTGLAVQLLVEAGHVARAAGRRDLARARYQRGVHLLRALLDAEAPLTAEGRAALDGFEAGFAAVGLTLPAGVDLFHANARAERFGRAEDLLFELAEAGWADARAEGLVFYGSLRDLSDGRLEAGGLARDELDEGLADLRRRTG